MSRIRFVHDDVLRSSEAEPGTYINLTSDEYVVLREVDMNDLRRSFRRFEERLRAEILRLLSMPTSEIFDAYGQLKLRQDAERQTDLQYGLSFYGDAPGKFNVLREGAVSRGLIAAGLAPKGTKVRPDAKKVAVRGIGSIAVFASELPVETRTKLIAATFDEHEDLDRLLKVGQSNIIGLPTVQDALANGKDALRFLDELAERTHAFIHTDKNCPGGAAGTGRTFAWAWFAQHLAAEGVWLQPIGNISNIRQLFPTALLPVAVRMAVPSGRANLAEAVLSVRRAARGTSREPIVRTFLALAGSSNLWLQPELAVSPLVAFKEWVQLNEEWRILSHLANEIYVLTCEEYGATLDGNWQASLLLTSKRIAGRGVEPFHWADYPNPRNTSRAAEILGKPVEFVPQFVADWAADLRSLLPLFKRKSIDRLVLELTPWLIYLLSLPPDLAPREISEVERKHVNSFGKQPDFVTFLEEHYVGANNSIAAAAVATMKIAWLLAATRDGFADKRAVPFDPDIDRIVKGGANRLSRTSRSAMDQHVLQILIEENRKGDYGFARAMVGRNGQEHWWRRVKDTETGRQENVFFPLGPIVVDTIMNSGLRLLQTTWIDSGEGDEVLVDLDTATEHRNTWPTATKGRRAGFLRAFDLMDGSERRRVVGMFLNTDKTSHAYDVPWIDPDVARAIEQLRDLQRRYNPIRRAVPAIPADANNRFMQLAVPDAFPVFRDPRHRLPEPVTDSRVRAYWSSLLAHAQERVNRELGFEYPLLIDGHPRFDIHALRVTTVTVLLENGVPVHIVQALVGHRSVMMTWYYNAVENSTVHREIQLGMERRRSNGTLGIDDPSDMARRVTDAEPITLRHKDDYAAIDLVRDHVDRRSGIDVFTHGICPGGDCQTGGNKLSAGRYGPVWRTRACSRCRYRLTGPLFLGGLVHRMNMLMAEIKLSTYREKRINDEVAEAEDAGRPTAALRQNAAREREDRDLLFSEWCAELHTVKEAERRLHAAGTSGENALLPAGGFDLAKLSLKTVETGDFELFHTLVAEAGLMPGASLDMPNGVEETRDNLMRRIIRTENLEDFFYSLEESAARRAMTALGDMLLAHSGGGERLQALLDGKERLSDNPAVGDLRETLVKAGETGRKLLYG